MIFSKKGRILLAALLALLTALSLSIFVSADESDVSDALSSAVSEVSGEPVSDVSDESDISDVSDTSDVSDVSDTSGVSDTSDDSSAALPGEDDDKSDISYGWLGITIIGGLLVAAAVIMFVMVKKNTKGGQRLVKFYRDYKSELKKIVWLSRKETIKQTGVVLVTLIIAVAVLGALDTLLGTLISLIK